MSLEYLLVGELIRLFGPIVAERVTDIISDIFKAWRNKDNPPLGACYFNPQPSNDFWELLRNGFRNADSVKILTTTGYTTYGAKGLKRLESGLPEKKRGELRFLLLDPNSVETIDRRVRELPSESRYTRAGYQNEIREATDVLRHLSQNPEYNPKIELRYFQQYPLWRTFIFDNRVAFVQPYLAGAIGDLSPAIGFKKGSKENMFSLFDFFLEYFDKTFEFGEVILP